MPNVKIFIDEAQYGAARDRLAAFLPDMRTSLCSSLSVGNEAFQLAIIPVLGLPDQPQINVELSLLERPDRTHGMVTEVAGQLREQIGHVTGQSVAVRIAMLDPKTYVALK
ncbi:MAG: hypothetical protein CMH13_06320 [Martelella sp.]|uniref:hypothetical protein n=1 Tax=unclassified Martelella TaxID=2629616 RepID=UPI000C4A67F1|nr:hypothetical protein [Martelella sp.]MAU20131.1 hypothetical protein [Martelella sp.]|tara:strand:+ start:244 stop:576 length:333 start_codon:yes stop_codon:yes gene_type:complete